MPTAAADVGEGRTPIGSATAGITLEVVLAALILVADNAVAHPPAPGGIARSTAACGMVEVDAERAGGGPGAAAA